MFGEIFAYYLGKSAGRNQERGRRRGRRELTRDDIVRARILFAVFFICIALAALAGVVGHISY